MSQLNAIHATESIKGRLIDFCRSDHFVTDPQLDQISQALWSRGPAEGGLCGDLWVEAAFPPKASGVTMQGFVDTKLISNKLANLLHTNEAFDKEWQLRDIQSQSVKAARASDGNNEKPAIVVSAGTGAGKTESFLFPLLDQLIQSEKRPGEGVSAIILYPMNALVTDQVERLEKWLKGQSDLKIFHFTGETPEDHKVANKENYPLTDQCRMRTRQQARGLEDDKGKRIDIANRAEQPDIIVTNYSMLEYMLCRPQDAVFFGENLRHIVLDEAHLYSGNLAAEITMLLRRTCAKSTVHPKSVYHYATSATLSEGSLDEQVTTLRKFGANIFSKSEDQVEVILGEKAPPQVTASKENFTLPSVNGIAAENWPDFTAVHEENGKESLVISNDEKWGELLSALSFLDLNKGSILAKDQCIATYLNEQLKKSPLFQELYELMYHAKLSPLPSLAQQLWGIENQDTLEATRRLLQLGAVARNTVDETPLLPNRIHWSIKAPDGLFFSFAVEHAPSPDLIFAINGQPIGYFYAPGFQTKPEADESFPLLVLRDKSNGSWYLGGIEQGSGIKCPPTAMAKTQDQHETLIQRISLYSLEPNVSGTSAKYFDHTSGKIDTSGITLYPVDEESTSTSNPKRSNLAAFGSDSRLQLAVIAEAALNAMPAYSGDSKKWKPAQGKQMLIFSDSRSEAARLGPLLTNNHERQLFRAMVVEALEQEENISIDDINLNISELTTNAENSPEIVKNALLIAINRLEDQKEGLLLGERPAEFVKKLAETERLQEFIHRETANRHQKDSWIEYKFKDNKKAVLEDIRLRFAKELARRTSWPDLDLETTGLLEVVYPGIEGLSPSNSFIGALPTEQLRQSLVKEFPQFITTVLDRIRDLGAVSIGSDEDNKEYSFGGIYIGKWASENSTYRNSVISFIPKTERSQFYKFVAQFLTEIGHTKDNLEITAKALLEDVYRTLWEKGESGRLKWLECDQKQTGDQISMPAIRIKFSELRIRKPIELYQCRDTGQVWPRSVCGLYLRSEKASLEPVTNEQLSQTPRIGRARREWKDSDIFRYGLWAEEHSAQIGASENRRIQDLFKSGIRNILSSTTTLELGIDIGGLNGVLMGNIPPGKANYLQRAGRAGRRANGSSLVISYARNSPYERKVFEDFQAYLTEKLRGPSIFLDRDDIIKRHLNAMLFSYFFSKLYSDGDHTGAMNAFGKMGTFTNIPQTRYWENGLKPEAESLYGVNSSSAIPWKQQGSSLAGCFDIYLNHVIEKVPNDLQEQANSLLKSTVLEDHLQSGFHLLIQDARIKVRDVIKTWEESYTDLLNQWESIPPSASNEERSRANAVHYQLKQLYNTSLIECFSDKMVLPRYGFPIGLSELKVHNSKQTTSNDHNISEYRLNRSASQAIREYAPGSRVLVGGKIVKSKGILKSWTGQDIPNEGMGLRAWYKWDQTSQRFEYNYSPSEGQNEKELLFVKHGFATSATEEPSFNGSPHRIRPTIEVYLQPTNADDLTKIASFGGKPSLSAQLHIGGELLAMNSGEYELGFSVCTKCGYSESEFNREGTGLLYLKSDFLYHRPLHDKKASTHSCISSDSPHILRHVHLAAKQITDFLSIDLNSLSGQQGERAKVANTISQALRLYGANILKLDPRELSILPVAHLGNNNARITLFDSLAGGAGHLRDLSNETEHWFSGACELIMNGHHRKALLSLLTSDAPTDSDGLPKFDILKTRAYLNKIFTVSTPQKCPELKSEGVANIQNMLSNFKK